MFGAVEACLRRLVCRAKKNGAPVWHAMISLLSLQSLFAEEIFDRLPEHRSCCETVSIRAATVCGDFPVVDFGVVGRLAHVRSPLGQFDAEVHDFKIRRWINEFQSINKVIWTKNSDLYSSILDFPAESASY